jgi:hypothetical protein
MRFKIVNFGLGVNQTPGRWFATIVVPVDNGHDHWNINIVMDVVTYQFKYRIETPFCEDDQTSPDLDGILNILPNIRACLSSLIESSTSYMFPSESQENEL